MCLLYGDAESRVDPQMSGKSPRPWILSPKSGRGRRQSGRTGRLLFSCLLVFAQCRGQKTPGRGLRVIGRNPSPFPCTPTENRRRWRQVPPADVLRSCGGGDAQPA